MPRIARTLLIALGALSAFAGTASAADFNPGPGTYTANTTTLKLTGPGGTNITGTDQGGTAVFSFDNVSIGSGVTISAQGSRPLKLVASGAFSVASTGTINASGANVPTDYTLGPIDGGPGGGAGGAQSGNPGVGPGGGGAAPTIADGGGGGGFGGTGARGAYGGGSGGTAAGGAAYGNLNVSLQGGSGGGGGSSVGGGGGGGAVAIFGSTVSIASGGQVRADGGGGALGSDGASGGGSGGGIVIRGDIVDVMGTLAARGGQGGTGSCCGDGGGGGGGRILYQYRTLVAAGTAFVTGGTSGTRSTLCAPSGCPGSFTSPDASGAGGVVSQSQAASASTGSPSGLSPNAATLNGTVNPHSNATTFHFDYGTTTGYGSRAPGSETGVGSDSSDHGVSAGVSLAPNTTYHYRVVASDSLGFTTNGADVAFTTPPAGGGGGGGGGGGTIPQPPPSLVPSSLSSAFAALVKTTKVTKLIVRNLVANSTVTVTCSAKSKAAKKACPYKKKVIKVTKASKSLSLTKPFKGSKRKLRVKTKLVIRVTAPSYKGKVFNYTIRKLALPKFSLQCTQPGATKAGSCL